MLHCLCFSFRCRFCSEMQSCAVLYLVCRGGVLRCGAKRNKYPWGASPRHLTAAPLVTVRRGGRPCPPKAPHSLKPSVGGDAHIAPPCLRARNTPSPPPVREVSRPLAVTEGLSKGIFRAPARGTFALGGKSTQKRRSNLRFENPFARLHPPRILTAFATRTLCPANFT